MDIKYQFSKINKKGMMYGVGDLLKYYADVSMQVAEKMNDLNQNKEIRNKLTDFLRTKTGVVGLTVDSMQNAIDTIMAKGDFFYFTVDGQKLCDILKDKEEVELQIHMDETYFITQLALSKFNPMTLGGFRRKFPDTIEGEKLKWQHWFEGEWKKDMKFKGFSNPSFIKTILEE